MTAPDPTLEAIRARLKAATPGPWAGDVQGVFQADGGGPICWVGDAYPRGENHPTENMDFIAHAPSDIAALLALLALVDAAREALEREREEWRTAPGGDAWSVADERSTKNFERAAKYEAVLRDVRALTDRPYNAAYDLAGDVRSEIDAALDSPTAPASTDDRKVVSPPDVNGGVPDAVATDPTKEMGHHGNLPDAQPEPEEKR